VFGLRGGRRKLVVVKGAAWWWPVVMMGWEVVGEFGRAKGWEHVGERGENEENFLLNRLVDQVFSFLLNFMLLVDVSSFDLLL
jgi:hypothetical protein